MEDGRADADVVYALQQMGFERDACVRAAVSCNNSVDAATDWLLAAQAQAERALATAQQEAGGGGAHAQGEEAGQVEGAMRRGGEGGVNVAEIEGREEGWVLVGGHPESPLAAIAGVDHLNIHETGMGGWVVMNGAFGVAEPLLFVGERSTWYGRLFAGCARKSSYDLLDTSSRPIVHMEKEFGLASTSARVSLVSQGALPAGPVQATGELNLLLGTVISEWDVIKRRLLLIDSTPNHAAGTIVLESPSVFDDTFRIKLGNTILGTVTRPRYASSSRRAASP